MSQVKRLVDDFRARNDRPETWFANQLGMSSKTLNSWFTRGRKSPLPPDVVKAMARVLELPYRTVLDAALYDSGYLPESSVPDARDVRGTLTDDAAVDELFGTKVERPDPPDDPPDAAAAGDLMGDASA